MPLFRPPIAAGLFLPALMFGQPVAAQRPTAGRAGPAIVLTAEQRATLAALGWPPPPPKIRPRDDLVFRRGNEPPVAGSLTGLHAFATVTTTQGDQHIARDDIGFILVNRRLIPRNAPALPLDSDAVLLANGQDVLVGRVEVDGEAIHVAARTVQQSEVALIHLHDPRTAEQQQAQDAGQANAPAAANRSKTPAASRSPTSAPPSAPPVPKGPGEIPWGKAMWRGTIRFKIIEQVEPQQEANGTYYVTWSEEADGPAGRPFEIKLHPVSLTYQYAWTIAPYAQRKCAPFSVSKQGSGLDGVNPDIHSGGLLQLELIPGSRVGNEHAGEFYLNVFEPVRIDDGELPINCTAPPQPLSWGSFSPLRTLPTMVLASQTSQHDCKQSAPVYRAAKPYVTIAGDLTCGTLGNAGFPYKTVRWQFDRGIPPSDPTMSQEPCETPRALLSLSQDQRRAALARLAQIRAEFLKAQPTEARLRATRNQLQPAFDLLLAAAASADVGKKLMELVTDDEMLETAAQTGQITEAEQQFAGELNKFIESYKAWSEFADDPGEWGKSKALDQAQEDAVGEHQNKAIEFALDMFNETQVLADAIGMGDGKAAGDYIDENLGAFGPLVPEYALAKARQYVEVSKQWGEAMKTLARLAAEGVRLAGQLAEANLGIKVRGPELQACLGQ